MYLELVANNFLYQLTDSIKEDNRVEQLQQVVICFVGLGNNDGGGFFEVLGPVPKPNV